MNKKSQKILFFVFVVLVLSSLRTQGVWGAPPPDPYQQRPDIFPCSVCTVDRDGNGVIDLSDENPVTRMVKQTRTASFRLAVIPGCNPGTIPSDINQYLIPEAANVGLTLIRNDTKYDFTVYISCGNVQIRKCGSINVFCLNGNLEGTVGYPYSCDVYLSDVLSGWTLGSRVGIPLHEIVGHCIATWNEQYATCGASCNFASTPGLLDFMNTGDLSRQGFTDSPRGRWERTMWSLAVDCGSGETYWDTCANLWTFSARTCPIGDGTFACKWNPQPGPYGQWVGPDGVVLWDGCDPNWQGRHSPYKALWMGVGRDFFDDLRGFRTTAPAC